MQKLPAILAMLIAGAASAAAPDAPAEPSAPAVQAAQPATPAAKRRAPSAGEALKQKCASRMYGASPRGRSAVNWTVYDRCMKNGGRL